MHHISHTSARLRLPFAAGAAAALLLGGLAPQAAADPEGALDADQLELGDHTEDFDAGDFTVRATDSAEVTVSEHSRGTEEGREFSQRLQLNGAGDTESRAVQFEAEAGQTVTVHAQSGGGDEDRALGLYDESWSELDQVPAYRGDSGSVLPAQTFTVEEDGTYWIASPSSGVNIYSMELGEDGGPPESAPWDEVTAPVIEDVSVSGEEPEHVEVSFTGVVGPEGGDLTRAYLLDESGDAVDEQISVSPGESGVITLTPPGSGDYEVELQLERHGEDVPVTAEPVVHTGFVLPLQSPEVTSVLTSEVDGEEAVAAAQWTSVPEAESYAVDVRPAGEEEFETAVEETEETEGEVPGLSVGGDYELQVTAHRGEDSASSDVHAFTVAGEVQRWDTAHAGVGSGGEVIEHEDGSLEFDLMGSNSKIADSEDGFWYHHTEIDPETENFTLSATFEVDDDSGKDNQSGFGIIAVDDFIPEEPAARYFNSAGTMAAKYEFGADGEEGVRYGTPGGKFVHGYTGGPTEASAERDMSDSRAFDWDYKPDYTEGSNTNPPRFEAGETYEFTLRRSNTGFHSIWHRDGEIEEVVHHDPDFLLAQSEDSFHLGLFAARDIAVTVTDWSFETIHPEDDEAAEEAPTQHITPRLSSDVTSTTPHTELEVPLLSNVHGEAVILDEQGEEVTDSAAVEPDVQELLELDGLEPGENSFIARLTPDEEQPQFAENEELESEDPVEIELSFTVNSYGQSGESIWVSPEGTAEGDGTEESPVDLHTAVAYVQPGQQIVLADGVYALEEAVQIERGNSGTEEQPITLMSEPGARATLDLQDSEGGGIILRGDWWHLHNLEITNGPGYQKPLHIQGHHNVIERVESHHNQDTGVQISGHDSEPPEMWPSYNTVVSSVAHNNADPQANDADGFAAKLTAGEGNVFRWTISHHNIDDGYDLYAKSTEGPIGTALIEESVAFGNGRLEDDPEATLTSDGQGFKLGGESQPGDHLLRNSVAYDNLANGVSSNSGPDPRMESVTTVFNGLVREDRSGAGVNLYTNNASVTDYRATGVVSFANSGRDSFDLREQDDDFLHDPTNYFNGRLSSEAVLSAGSLHTGPASFSGGGWGGPAGAAVMQNGGEGASEEAERPSEVTEDWFVSMDHESIRPEIAEDGSVDMNGLFELTDAAPSDTGARLSSNPDPTELEVFPAVTTEDDPEEPGDGDEGSAEAAEDGAGPDEEAGDETGGDSSEGSGTDQGAAGRETDGKDAGDQDAEASAEQDGLAVTGTQVALVAAVLVLLLLVGAALLRRSKAELTRLD